MGCHFHDYTRLYYIGSILLTVLLSVSLLCWLWGSKQPCWEGQHGKELRAIDSKKPRSSVQSPARNCKLSTTTSLEVGPSSVKPQMRLHFWLTPSGKLCEPPTQRTQPSLTHRNHEIDQKQWLHEDWGLTWPPILLPDTQQSASPPNPKYSFLVIFYDSLPTYT